LWFVKSNGVLWTPNANQYPYLWLVASGETVLNQRKNFDQVLTELSLDCNSLCFLLQNCDIKKARVMVIPCCRLDLPQDNTLSTFISSVNSSNSEGHYYIGNTGATWTNLANQIHTIATMSSTPPHGIGEAYMDVCIVNQQFYGCKSILYRVVGPGSITQANTAGLSFKSCFKTCNDSLPAYDKVLFPIPEDLSSTPVNFTLNPSAPIDSRLCAFDNLPATFSNTLSPNIIVDQITNLGGSLCCNEVADYDSISFNNINGKVYLWYQNGDVTSSNFGQVEGLVLYNNDIVNNLIVMKNSLLVFYDSNNDNAIDSSTDLVYFNSVSSYSGSGITISQPTIKKINCQP
jgi:hypothetical protein